MLVKNVSSPSVISSSLYSLLLPVNISGNLLMCNYYFYIIFLALSTFLRYYFYVYYEIRKVALFSSFYVLMLANSYTLSTLIHLGEIYFSEMQ